MDWGECRRGSPQRGCVSRHSSAHWTRYQPPLLLELKARAGDNHILLVYLWMHPPSPHVIPQIRFLLQFLCDTMGSSNLAVCPACLKDSSSAAPVPQGYPCGWWRLGWQPPIQHAEGALWAEMWLEPWITLNNRRVIKWYKAIFLRTLVARVSANSLPMVKTNLQISYEWVPPLSFPLGDPGGIFSLATPMSEWSTSQRRTLAVRPKGLLAALNLSTFSLCTFSHFWNSVVKAFVTFLGLKHVTHSNVCIVLYCVQLQGALADCWSGDRSGI